jgi:hypothetical protein
MRALYSSDAASAKANRPVSAQQTKGHNSVSRLSAESCRALIRHRKNTPASEQGVTRAERLRAEYRTEISACDVGQLSLVNRTRIDADILGFYQ